MFYFFKQRANRLTTPDGYDNPIDNDDDIDNVTTQEAVNNKAYDGLVVVSNKYVSKVLNQFSILYE